MIFFTCLVFRLCSDCLSAYFTDACIYPTEIDVFINSINEVMDSHLRCSVYVYFFLRGSNLGVLGENRYFRTFAFNLLLGRSQAGAIDSTSMGLGSQTFAVTFQAFYVVAKSFMLLLKIALLFNGYKLE